MSRIRANQITNQSADGAPTVQNGLVITGVTTSTTFSGSGASLTNIPSAQLTGALPALDGSNLTNITSTTINNNADNRVITGSGTANTLNAEQYLTWNGQIFKVNAATNDNPFQLDTGSSNGAHMRFFRNGTQLHFFGCGTGISLGDSEDLSMRSYDNILFSTGNSSTERVRIDSSGRVLIGTTTEGLNGANDLTIGGSGSRGITIRSGTSNDGNLWFSDGTSGNAEYRGYVQYEHANDRFNFGTAANTRLSIDSDGRLLVGTTSRGQDDADNLTIDGSGQGTGRTGLTIRSATNTFGSIFFSDATSGAAQYDGVVAYDHSTQTMRFSTASTQRMFINSNGQVTQPYQASFAAMSSQNGYNLNGQVFPFNTTTHNIGSHFNTSNYRFTAPVAGRYLFTFYSILNSSGQGRYEILINGAADQNGTRVHMTPTTTDWDHVSTSWILNLAANDYIQMYSQSNTGWHGNHWQRFCGELLS